MRNFRILAGACVLLLCAGCASAQGGRAARMMEQMQQRFTTADADRDGRLTREEARQGMPWVHTNFDAIDTARTGAITLAQLQQYARSQRGRGRAGAGTQSP